MGPLNFHKNPPPDIPSYLDIDEREKQLKKIIESREEQVQFEKRKSGAQYRGEVLITNGRPDGKGFKVFKGGKSIYEGWFENGLCNGYGRAISSKMEIY